MTVTSLRWERWLILSNNSQQRERATPCAPDLDGAFVLAALGLVFPKLHLVLLHLEVADLRKEAQLIKKSSFTEESDRVFPQGEASFVLKTLANTSLLMGSLSRKLCAARPDQSSLRPQVSIRISLAPKLASLKLMTLLALASCCF